MTHNIAKIRAALESALARATSGSRVAELRDAIVALAELEKAAAEPRLFTAGEMFDAHEDGATHRAEWQRSDTFKLIQERAP